MASQFSSDINEQIADTQCEIGEDLTEETSVLENVENAAPEYDIIEFDTGIFIEEIGQFPCLWNTSIAAYKDRNIKANAWNRPSLMFGKEGECSN